ncbi:hypothetical protein OPV22_008614 [Ensete ventricosum]|uniref:Uncharacterized protein n=1 Tax=Ensete ventricosum TaxID=4639 RepID=A0AAV8RHE1_ENSVE|nr:hypothetical protein OPV22_008614 [Ensete ventricosum]
MCYLPKQKTTSEMIVRNQWAGSTIVRRRVNQRHYHVTITCEWKLPFSSLARLRFSRFDNRKGFSYPNASHPLSIACATGRGPWGGPNPWLTGSVTREVMATVVLSATEAVAKSISVTMLVSG